MRTLLKRKKGIVFTILAVFLSVMFLLLLSDGINKNIDNSIDLSKTRSLTMSSYNEYLNSYVLYSCEMSAKSCLFEISKHMRTNRYFFSNWNDFENNLESCMSEGVLKISGVEIPLSNMQNLTLSYLLNQLTDVTEEDYSISTDYSINNIVFMQKNDQIGPDEIGIDVSLQFNISSDDSFIQSEEKDISLFFDATDIFDPYYGINIADKNITKVVLVGATEYEDVLLEDFLNNMFHVQLIGIGNSIIDRFINNSDPTDIGLVSFINESDIPGADPLTTSNVDVHYVNGTIFTCDDLYCQVDLTYTCLNDFSIDSNTFWTLQSTYRLNVSNWADERCP